jgi:molybdenum cofactor cytidylyltransferase
MHLKHIPIEQSPGTILVHNVIGLDGHKALSKGRLVQPQDIPTLQAVGLSTVYAALLDPGDVREDDAAQRLARAAAGAGIESGKPSGGRVNLYAAQRGLLRVNLDALDRFNALKGVTLATIARHSTVGPRKMAATLKTIGLALPETTLAQAEEIARGSGAPLEVAPFTVERAGIILTGSSNGKAKVQETFAPPIHARVEDLGCRVVSEEYVAEEESEIAEAIDRAAKAGAQMIVIAGETSIMDIDDVTPRGIQRAGGEIELYGAPVEPGNLLLLAYRGRLPIVGAPGCVKSRETNVVDLILPRLMAGGRVTRRDVAELADGGLLAG